MAGECVGHSQVMGEEGRSTQHRVPVGNLGAGVAFSPPLRGVLEQPEGAVLSL